MSGWVKRWQGRQRHVAPGAPVPGTGTKDNKKRRRSALKMQPYKRPRKGGKEDITS